ncbi:flagellar biosynthesis/type III secretory pathway protein FliH [Pelomonas saccharophila]|uniref:Flagellar assembly protein FliH n=1 Tax=Roseateles saccharophilus TaxID=304 RepID=A0ABU1YH97_ROSSA|nr:FliH/SctL family protein [Roseateles saccharophilus]MDR7268215.1 flagellar biosynthesis/type III secretory pathway protein FliH [Roseateles saccharophilus]
MSTKSVLKASLATESPASRFVLRSPAEVGGAPLDDPGIWISQANLEALKDRCIKQGRAEGEEQGRRLAQQAAQLRADSEAKARLEQELKGLQDRHAREQAEKWRGLASALASQTQALREQLEAEVTEWTFVAVVRLLGQRAAEDAAAVVRKVLAESRLEGSLTVLLHAQDLASLVAGGAMASDAWPANVIFAADAKVGLGGCLIQSDVQTLDARLEVQLELLRERLDKLRRQRAGTED